MFSIMTIESSTTEAGGDDQRHQRQVVDRVAELVHHGQRADQRHTGTEMLGMIVAGRLRRKTKITRTTSTIASTSSKKASLTEERITPGAVCHDLDMHRCGQARQQLRQLLLDLVDGLDDVGARLALHVEHDGRRVVEPGALLDVLGGLADRGHVAQQDPGEPFW